MKKNQIDTDFDKTPKIFHFSNLCVFFQIIDKLPSL